MAANHSLVEKLRRMFCWLVYGNDYHHCDNCNQVEVMRGLPKRIICRRGFDNVIEVHKKQISKAEKEMEAAAGPLDQPPTRFISYWSDSGHFFKWSYRKDQLQQVQRHIGRIAADPLIEFNWHDAARVNELIRFTELADDCQDVVGW